MSFELDAKSFQEKCWAELYNKLFVEFFNNFEYVGKDVTITFNYKPFLHDAPLETNYTDAILRKSNYCRPLRVTTRIKKNSTGEKIDSDNLGPINIPELTERGFIIAGHSYDVANQFREAHGWYLTCDKEGNLIMSLKTRVGGKFIIFERNNELFVEHNSKKIGFGIFLKAITGLDSASIIDTIEMNNEIINNTITNQLSPKGIELSTIDCVRSTLVFMLSGNKSVEELKKVPDSTLMEMLNSALDRVDICSEGYERYKKFVTFQRRAEGAMLLDDVTLTNGDIVKAGTNLSRVDLIRMDTDDSIKNIVVEHQNNTFSIKKFPLDEGKFGYNMMLNIASIAFTTFGGLGMLDDRDSLENRVIENVASYIVECVHDYLLQNVCRQIDSFRNRNVSNISALTSHLSRCGNSDYVVQRYKKETNVQLKDDSNIIAEISKSYKLAYKKNSAKARVNDAIRTIKVRQYMRVCPVDTPESENVGLNTYLTNTASIDENGFITAQYQNIHTGEYVAMNALDEMGVPIMLWNEDYDNQDFVRVHIDGEFTTMHKSFVHYKDTSPSGLFSLSTSYVPFIGNNKPKRALMATNMNRQAIHVLGSERPIVTTATDNMVTTGIIRAKDVVKKWADERGLELTPEEIENTEIEIRDILSSDSVNGGLRRLQFTANSPVLTDIYEVDIPFFMASSSGSYYNYIINDKLSSYKNNDIVYHHRDIAIDNITLGNKPNFGGLVDISEDQINEYGYALGRDMKVIFKSYKGYTYEDAVVINRDLFEDKSLTSIYVTEVVSELQENPNLFTSETFGIAGLNFTSEEKSYMQDNGLPRLGSYIKGGQVVIGKIRRETSNLGNDKIDNASVTLDSKSEGWVINTRIIRGEVGKGKQDMAIVSIASFNDITIGDKTVGRHGNKGVIAKIVPREDLPFAEDGTIPDMVLNPLGIIARGNVGQLCECIVGMAGYKMNKRFVIPDLSDENYNTMLQCKETLEKEYGFTEQTFYDGETGLPYPKKMLAGVMHMYKLVHIVTGKAKVVGAANNAVVEKTQQPRNGQRISELQTNCYIAHGSTETIDSLFSLQSDDIKGAAKLQFRTRNYGSSIEDGIDIQGENKSDEIVRAHLRTLGVDVVSDDKGIRFKYLTDEDILNISGHGTENIIDDSSKNAVLSLHDEYIFGAESKKVSRTIGNRIKRRTHYGRIELGYSVIMPVLLRSSYFLKRFRFVKVSFGKVTGNDDGDQVQALKMTLSRVAISDKVSSSLITGKYTTLVYSPDCLCYFDTKDFNSLTDSGMREQATKILEQLGFNISELVDKQHSNKLYSPHKVDIFAEMFRGYNSDNLSKIGKKFEEVNKDYDDYLYINSDYANVSESDSVAKRYDYVNMNMSVAYELQNNKETIYGEDFFVTKMLIMPASFRARYTTPRGERHNDVDATYIKVLTTSAELRNHMDRHMPIDFDVSRLYQALDSCYKKPEGSKSPISVSDLLLSSNINKRSTVIRGCVGAKKISYSCRSVITVNPTLKLTECGIPYKHALSMWEDELVWALSDKQLIDGKTALTGNEISKLLKYLSDGNYFAIGYDLFDIRNNPIDAAKKVEGVIVRELKNIMKDAIVVLNREPALHKFNVLSFIPKLVDGLAIQLHPLVCTAYNADFDGDTMSGIDIKADTARTEAREKMMTTNNIINPKDGANILALKQDIVLGLYMLTMLKGNDTNEIAVQDREPVAYYSDINVLQQDLDVGFISIYDYIAFYRKATNKQPERMYVSTAGRIIFNNLMPALSGYTSNKVGNTNVYMLRFDERIDSKKLGKIVTDCFETYTDNRVTIDLLDRLKEVGIKYADLSGATISINDFSDKSYLVQGNIDEAMKVVNVYDKLEKLKLLPTDVKKQAVVKFWSKEIKKMNTIIENAMERDGSVYAIINSGARGKSSDFISICGIVGQVRDVQDKETLEKPIFGNFLKGLTADEYFISTYQARRGQISTSTKTEISGKNNRDISHMLNNVKVVEDDCGTEPYRLKITYDKVLPECAERIVGKKITDCKYKTFIGKTIVESMPSDGTDEQYLTIEGLRLTQLTELELDGVLTPIQRELSAIHKSLLHGRVIEENTNDWLPKNLLSSIDYANSDSRGSELIINDRTIKWLEENPQEFIDVKLLIGCKSHGGICSKCYGKDIETKKLIEVGKYIGLISAMAISEVATQGTMNVHHASASDTGMGDVASRFKSALCAREVVRVSRKHDKETHEYTYEVSICKGNNGKFTKVADKLTMKGAIREQGLAMENGIVNITNRITADGKTIVQVINNDNTFEYAIKRNELIVKSGEEVRQYQPLTAYYDYNQIMKLNVDFAKEFYIMDFAGIFYNSGNPIRAIHFELIGREQANYQKVLYTVDGSYFHEAFPVSMTQADILEELSNRYEPAEVCICEITPQIMGKNSVMDSRDILANAFSEQTFSRIGRYCMNGKKDCCSSPLSNLFVGKKTRGNDDKVFNTGDENQQVKKVTKKREVVNDLGELDLTNDNAEDIEETLDNPLMDDVEDFDNGLQDVEGSSKTTQQDILSEFGIDLDSVNTTEVDNTESTSFDGFGDLEDLEVK